MASVRITPGLAGALLVGAAFALGVTKVEDWDAFTHLALGREIVGRRWFPDHELFTFPTAALPYYNPEWLFDVVLYLAYVLGGYTGLILLKAALASLTALILWKDSGLGSPLSSDRVLGVTIRAAVLVPFLLMIRYRIVERPDLVLMVFLSFTIYALNAYLTDGRRYLYLLPGTQVVWANMHPSTIVAVVPFMAILAGGVLLRVLERRRGTPILGTPSPAQLRTVALVFAGVLVASTLNPYGTHALTQPFRIVAAPWLTQYVAELQPPRLGLQPGPFVAAGVLAITFIFLARRLPVIPLLLVAPFVYLGLSALRFMFLLGLVAAPVLGRNALAIVGAPASVARRVAIVTASAAVVLGVASTGLALAGLGPFAAPALTTGLGIQDRFLPERALQYLDRVGAHGRVFNTVHWGGYLAWRDFPRRLAIVDGRGHLPEAVLADVHFATTNAGVLDRLQAAYAFDIVVVAYPRVDAGSSTEFISPQWALVYWDDVALVYLRRSTAFAGVIARDEYRHVKPAHGVPHLRWMLDNGAPSPALEQEIRRNVAETGSSLGYTFLGFVDLQARRYDAALQAFRRVRDYSSRWHAYQGLALAYWGQGDLAQAVEYYKAAAAVFEDPVFFYNVGLGLTRLGNDRDAVQYLERARARDPGFTATYPLLIDAYRRLGERERERQVAAAYEQARLRARVHEHIRNAVRLARAGNAEAAVGELQVSLRLDHRNAATRHVLGNIYQAQGRFDAAIVQQQAALEADPRFAPAHYALGRLYQQRGDATAARAHLDAYIRLDRDSYLSWKVREELAGTPR
ncbi:MAG TPA: tetratricopeptide repeat protein [Methylomirabilota bacterium]|nr:tetratricopeptide repeat protein [Methylomirabilota bacterium]